MILQIIQIFLLFVLPVLLVYYKIIPFRYRKHTLITVSITAFILVIYERWTFSDLGLRFDNFIPSIIPYTIFTILAIIILLTVAKITKREPQPKFYSNKKLIYSIMLGSIAQEFLFRGFLFPKLNAIFNGSVISGYIAIIIVNTILFTIIHTIYSNTITTLITIFVAGLAFAAMYGSHPNLVLISISHIILNQTAIRYNFYSEEKIRKTKTKTINNDVENMAKF